MFWEYIHNSRLKKKSSYFYNTNAESTHMNKSNFQSTKWHPTLRLLLQEKKKRSISQVFHLVTIFIRSASWTVLLEILDLCCIDVF